MSKRYDYALISGGFDPVHIGHLAMIKDAKKIADDVIVLLNSDKWLVRKKGKPFMVEAQRAQILEEFESVSEVIIQEKDDDDSSNNAIIDFYHSHKKRTICYCNGGDRSQEDKIREAETCKNLEIMYGAKKGPLYTEEEDAFLLYLLDRHGYGEWEKIKNDFYDMWQFKFDWWMRGRKVHDIEKRCSQLLNMIKNEPEYFKKMSSEFNFKFPAL